MTAEMEGDLEVRHPLTHAILIHDSGATGRGPGIVLAVGSERSRAVAGLVGQLLLSIVRKVEKSRRV